MISVTNIFFKTEIAPFMITQGKIFEFEGKITNVVLDNGWEYFSCNICKSRVDGSGPTTRCNKHDKEIDFPLHR